jgi:hypothetical protein
MLRNPLLRQRFCSFFTRRRDFRARRTLFLRDKGATRQGTRREVAQALQQLITGEQTRRTKRAPAAPWRPRHVCSSSRASLHQGFEAMRSVHRPLSKSAAGDQDGIRTPAARIAADSDHTSTTSSCQG